MEKEGPFTITEMYTKDSSQRAKDVEMALTGSIRYTNMWANGSTTVFGVRGSSSEARKSFSKVIFKRGSNTV